MKRKSRLKYLVILTAFFALLVLSFGIIFGSLTHERNPEIGFSFSTQYVDYLGLEVSEVYESILSDFDNLEHLRIPIYWNELEPRQGEYNFDTIDYLMNRAADTGIGVTLVIGMKVPRWPECFIPDWAGDTDQNIHKAGFFSMIQTVVERYQDHPALERWQVENEPFFPFGECPTPDPDRFEQTVRFVRLLDSQHEIQSTTSGEQSLWFLRTWNIDVLGVSLYREVWNKTLGAFIFPHTPRFYTIQRILAEPFVNKIIISELQMEPWIPEDIQEIDESIGQLYQIFPVEDMESNLFFAKQIGVDEIYFWGVEWWYYMMEHGESRMWNAGIEMLK